MRPIRWVTLAVSPVVLSLASTLPAHASAVTCQGLSATIVGTGAGEVIHGTSGRDVIAGLGGNDTIYGLTGNDVVCGGRGADRIFGGAGSDRLGGGLDFVHATDEGTTERIGDVVSGGRGDDAISLGTDTRAADDIAYDAVTWERSPRAVHVDLAARTATGDGHDSFTGGRFWVVGSVFSDTIDGSGARDRINAGPGSDVVRARGGDDIVVADNGASSHGYADRVWGGAGNDRLTSTTGQDRLIGGPGDDVIDDIGASNDVLLGGDGDDQLIGEIADTGRQQAFAGGRGFDELDLMSNRLNPSAAASTGDWDMATGEMTFTLDQAVAVTATGFELADLATFGTTWSVSGTAGADTLLAAGTAGTHFTSFAGDDTFMGSAADDVFDAGEGQDHSLGMGDGEDTCTAVEVFDVDDCEHIS